MGSSEGEKRRAKGIKGGGKLTGIQGDANAKETACDELYEKLGNGGGKEYPKEKEKESRHEYKKRHYVKTEVAKNKEKAYYELPERVNSRGEGKKGRKMKRGRTQHDLISKDGRKGISLGVGKDGLGII